MAQWHWENHRGGEGCWKGVGKSPLGGGGQGWEQVTRDRTFVRSQARPGQCQAGLPGSHCLETPHCVWILSLELAAVWGHLVTLTVSDASHGADQVSSVTHSDGFSRSLGQVGSSVASLTGHISNVAKAVLRKGEDQGPEDVPESKTKEAEDPQSIFKLGNETLKISIRKQSDTVRHKK